MLQWEIRDKEEHDAEMARRTTPSPAELPRDSAEIDLLEGTRERERVS